MTLWKLCTRGQWASALPSAPGAAGLSLSARQRGGDTEELRAVMGTPFTGFGGDAEADSPQWGMSAPGTPFRSMSTNGFGLGHGIGHAGV